MTIKLKEDIRILYLLLSGISHRHTDLGPCPIPSTQLYYTKLYISGFANSQQIIAFFKECRGDWFILFPPWANHRCIIQTV